MVCDEEACGDEEVVALAHEQEDVDDEWAAVSVHELGVADDEWVALGQWGAYPTHESWLEEKMMRCEQGPVLAQ